MVWTLGVLEQPLGNARLQTVRLIATLLDLSSSAVSAELMQLSTINVLLVSIGSSFSQKYCTSKDCLDVDSWLVCAVIFN